MGASEKANAQIISDSGVFWWWGWRGSKNIKRISLCVKKEYAATIERRAAELGKPVNRYIVDLIRQDIDANSGK